MKDKFDDGDIGMPVWVVFDGYATKLWIYDVTADGKAVCAQHISGYKCDVTEPIEYNKTFWSYYSAKKSITEEKP